MKIFAYNAASLEGIEKTFLSDDTAIGATAFPVKNTNSFVNGQKVLVGELGRERSEVLTVNGAPTATGLTLTAATFPHDADDPIYAIKYDKVRVYRSTAGELGSYSLLATINIDVDNADLKTWYEDALSLDTYWYKVSFYDSVGAAETEQSDAVQATGFARDQIGSVITEIARQVGDPDFIDMDMQTYLDNANDVSTDLTTQAKRPYRFLKRNQALNIGAASSSVAFPTNLWKINYLEVNDTSTVSTRVYQPKKVSATKARYDLALYTLGADRVQEVAYDDEANALIVVPKSLLARTGAFNLHFYKIFDPFTSFSSRIEGPTRLAYKLALRRDYYLMKADSNSKYLTKAQTYDRMYSIEVAKLQREKNIDAGGPGGLAPDKKQYIQWGGPRYHQ